jgi:ELWxxDGT repeat protein
MIFMKGLFTSVCLCFASFSTMAQLSLVADINAGGNSDPSAITVFNNKMYFAADDGVNGRELWVYDGTNAPTMLTNLNAGSASSFIATLGSTAVLNGVLYFSANNGTNGKELFKYDGVNAPQLVADIETGSASSSPVALYPYNGKLYFGATTVADGYELWSYDPATNATAQLTTFATGSGSSFILEMIAFNNKLYISGGEMANLGMELYVFDPANNTTTLVQDINSGSAYGSPLEFHVYNNILYFRANTVAYGWEFYSYTGTGTPTRLTDLNPGSASTLTNHPLAGFRSIILFNNKFYMTAQDASSFSQLFQFDPSNNTLSLVHVMNPGVSGICFYFTEYANKLYFSSVNVATGVELYSYDGVNAPTLAADVTPGATAGNPTYLTVFQDALYFGANNGVVGNELFKFYDVTLSVEEKSSAVRVNVYPNPASTLVQMSIKLNTATDISIGLADITGRVVYATGMQCMGVGEHHISIPISEFSSGMYYYTVSSANGTLLAKGKLVKQ